MGSDFDDKNFYSEEDEVRVDGERGEDAEVEVAVEEPKTRYLKIDGDEDLSVDDEEGEDFSLSSEEKMRVFADVLMSSVIGKKSIRQYAIGVLFSSLNPRIFRDENHILYKVFYDYSSKLRRINIDEEFVSLYLQRNRKIISQSKEFIDIHAYGDIDGSEELGYISGVLKHFKRLENMEEVSEEEFNLVFEKYLIEFKAIETAKALANASRILTEGMKVGRSNLMGFDDSSNYIKKRLAEIEGLVNKNMGSGFVNMSEVLMEEKEDGKKPYLISDFGKLTSLNNIFGGIFSGTFYQVIAPPKSGKTKFCAYLGHIASVTHGTNISVWAVEGGKEAWTAQMRAIHFNYIYNQDADVRTKKYGVTQDAILHNRYPSDELRELELSSKLDLASNPEYGSVDYIDRPFNVETFIEDIDTSVKGNGSKLVIIDYMQLIGSETNINERERISRGYQDLLAYCRANNVGVLTPAQYKQDVFDELVKMKNTVSADMRTSGAGSSEVLRTPDIIIALWATTADLKNNSMKILSVPCRFNKAFPEQNVYADLGVCEFISLDD